MPAPRELLKPFLIVKPLNTDPRPSRERKVTTVPARLPSSVVISGPCSLATVIALPRKLIRS